MIQKIFPTKNCCFQSGVRSPVFLASIRTFGDCLSQVLLVKTKNNIFQRKHGKPTPAISFKLWTLSLKAAKKKLTKLQSFRNQDFGRWRLKMSCWLQHFSNSPHPFQYFNFANLLVSLVQLNKEKSKVSLKFSVFSEETNVRNNIFIIILHFFHLEIENVNNVNSNTRWKNKARSGVCWGRAGCSCRILSKELSIFKYSLK